MKFGINKKNKIVFCYDGFLCPLEVQSVDIDLILSPEYYWTRKFKIPANSIKEAKKTLPALFEDVLPKSNYEYDCVKLEENEYLCFAYDNDKILQQLKEANFNISKIKSIRFSQLELAEFKDFTINIDNSYYSFENDILLKLPFDFTEKEKVNIQEILKNKELSSKKIDFKFYTSIIDKKLLVTVAILCIIISSVNFSKLVSINSKVSEYETKKENLKAKYNLPATSYQMKSIIAEYSGVYDNQEKLKDLLSDVLKFKKYSSNGKLISLRLSKNKINVTFENINTNIIKNYLNKKYKVINTNNIGNKTIMEVSYE